MSDFPAFPQNEFNAYTNDRSGMTLRDWFASHCPDSWIDMRMPKTVGGVRDDLVNRGLIPAARKQENAVGSYTEGEAARLWIALRWEYADAMLAERSKA